MYNLDLTLEQIEFRDTVRDFVERELKPLALHSDRLQAPDKPLLTGVLDQASQMGLRALTLSEEAGGAGGDLLTACIVLEELGAGDADVATTLAHTAALAGLLFDRLMSREQRARLLPRFLADDRCHLACAALAPDPDATFTYHLPGAAPAGGVSAVRQANGDWLLEGTSGFVPNAPVAGLMIVQARAADGAAPVVFVVARDTAGLTVREPDTEGAASEYMRWYHGTGGHLEFRGCRVAAENVLAGNAALDAVDCSPLLQAVNLGIGRAACAAAVEYAKLRVQGAKPIIQHQAIGEIMAGNTIKMEVARNAVWKAAWCLDHPDSAAARECPPHVLCAIARVYTSEAIHEVVEDAAECFGGMGVMLDMPQPRQQHDARVFLHTGGGNIVAKFRIAEATAGFDRGATAAAPRAGVEKAA